SRPPTPPDAPPTTSRSSNACATGTAAGAAPPSLPPRSHAVSPKRSGGCSPATNPLLRQAPCERLTAPTVPFRIALPERAPIEPSRPKGRDRGMSQPHNPPPPSTRDPPLLDVMTERAS